MKPTDELKNEHKAIKIILNILEEICRKIKSGDKPDVEDVEKIVEFIRVFADRCHHGKEEDLLFVEMEKAGMSRETGPIKVMLEEHKIGREYVLGLSSSLEKYKEGAGNSADEIVKNSMGYIELLRQHIDKEDNILYPMADERILDETQKKLEEQFEKVEIEKIGKGKHEEFHKLIDELKAKYL